MLPLFVGQDALTLLVGLPLLLGSVWLARRGALIGQLLWTGALFYVLYDYGYYALGAPFNALFVPYLALMSLSAYALIALVTSIDGAVIRERIGGAVPARIVGAFLATVAILFITLWTAMSVSAAASGSPLDPILRVVTTMHLTVQLPALLVGGFLLWRRQPLGYVVAAGLLLQVVAYLVGLSAITLLQESVMRSPVDLVAVLPGFVVGAAGLVLIKPFVRGAAEVEPSPARSRRRGASAPAWSRAFVGRDFNERRQDDGNEAKVQPSRGARDR